MSVPLYNQFVPAIAREIAQLVTPHTQPIVYVVSSCSSIHNRDVLSVCDTFHGAVEYLLDQNYSWRLKYMRAKGEFYGVSQSPGNLHSCACQEYDQYHITVERIGTTFKYQDPHPLFRWVLHVGRFYNGQLLDHWDHCELGRRGGRRICFVLHLLSEEEVRTIHPEYALETKLALWRSFQQYPPRIQTESTDEMKSLTEEQKLILDAVITQVEDVNESEMMQTYRHAMHKYLTE
jgi:hypothetical protein